MDASGPGTGAVTAEGNREAPGPPHPECYLLTWNPAGWQWDTAAQDAATLARGADLMLRWSCGNNRQIKTGSRIFLVKQGDPPRGLIGTGTTTSDVFDDAHWDPERAARGDRVNYANVKFDTLIDPSIVPPLPPHAMPSELANGVHWSTPSSGISVPMHLQPTLEEAWGRYLATLRPLYEPPPDEQAFLGVLRRYREERAVFQSTAQAARYMVRGVGDDRCEVERLDGGDVEVCTLSWYRLRANQIVQAGGRAKFVDLGGTVAERIIVSQSSRLGLTADKKYILDLSRPAAALDNFCDILRHLDVDRSGVEPKRYKPILMACVIEAVEALELTDNHVEFDRVLPRFLAKAAALGIEGVGPEQAARAFFHLTGDQFWMLCYRDVARLVEGATLSPGAIRERVTHATIKDTYWRLLQVPAFRTRLLRELAEQWWPEQEVGAVTETETAASGLRYWWVNQGKTYEEERRLGVIWAPQKNEQGNAYFHWTNVSQVRAGDFVFNYADGAIRAVSVATSDGHAGQQPPELAGNAWGREGWTAGLSYHELATPVPLASVNEPIKQLGLERGPINKVGAVNQAYLFELNEPAAAVIAKAIDLSDLPEALAARLRAIVPPVSSGPRSWAIGLGPRGRYWEECYRDGVAVVGCDQLGDFRAYKTKQAFKDALVAARGPGDPDVDPVNDALMCYQFCHEVRPGDVLIAKVGSDRVLGAGVVTSDYAYDESRKEYRNVRKVDWQYRGELAVPEDRRVPLKTLTEVTEFRKFMEFVNAHFPVPRPKPGPGPHPLPPYTVDDALDGLFIPREEFELILKTWGRKKNAILQGPPGVGKTFVAKRLAYALMGVKDPTRLEMVQFHQSYAYEDFVQGWRPRRKGGFRLKNGAFYAFCRAAGRDEARRPHVFIIDEVNRGNLSRIFGELMMLIEPDHRGPDHAIPLTYSRSTADRFYVPENVYVLGLMNTADRSLAMVDYALRRRFCFTQLRPALDGEPFRQFLLGRGAPAALLDRIVARLGALNAEILADKNLGGGFQVGHSYFCPANGEALDDRWYADVVHRELAPLVREYWFDDADKAEALVAELLK